MAHLASLLLVPADVLSRTHTRESLVAGAVRTSYCSHFIAAFPRIRQLLNEGTAVQSEMWHPIAKPHYWLAHELPPFVAMLQELEDSDEEIKKDAWILAEVRRLKEACDYAVQHRLALVIFLSNTLSKPPMKRKG